MSAGYLMHSKAFTGDCRWRTCLIVRELEQEIDALAQGQEHRNKLKVGGTFYCKATSLSSGTTSSACLAWGQLSVFAVP